MITKRIAAAALSACACVLLLCSCGSSAPSSDITVPSSNTVAAPVQTEVPLELAAALTLNADGTLDGMDYRYNDAWTETSEPLTGGVIRTYDIDLGTAGTVHLKFQSVNDENTSAAVQNLRTQSDEDREAVISSMLAAKEGTLTGASSERAATPPAGTRAMWSYQGTDGDQYVHGYTYVGGSQLYEVSVTGSEAAYAAFEPAWKSLVNQIRFPEIEPVLTPEPTSAATPVPSPVSAPQPSSISDAYLGRWSGPEDDGSSWFDITIDPSSTDPNGYTITGMRTFPESDPSYFTLNAVGDGDGLVYTGKDTSGGNGAYDVQGTITLGDGDTPWVVMSLAYDRYGGEIVMWFYLDQA
ncbi:MAG: hypothetical protein HDQ87_02885 [Clostridia bacterium]|nr:hypothetical protein [Clostridia bacterium]